MPRKVGSKGNAKLVLTGLEQSPNEDRMNRAMHQRGFQLWRADLSSNEIQKRLHISHHTWKWLLKDGCKQLPSYEGLLIEEVRTIRNSASEAALIVSSTAVEVLRDRMDNAGKANGLMSDILGRMKNGAVEENDVKALKALLPIANITSVAEAYRQIYGASAAMRGLHPTVDHSKAEYRQPLEAVQGKTDEKKSLMPAEQRDQVVADVSNWTEEQLQEYIAGKGEPAPSEVANT